MLEGNVVGTVQADSRFKDRRLDEALDDAIWEAQYADRS